MMFYTFSSEFIEKNKEYLDEIVKDTLDDAFYAISVYVMLIMLGAMIT